MQTCELGHEPVAYADNDCPLCIVIRDRDQFEGRFREEEKRADDLQFELEKFQ